MQSESLLLWGILFGGIGLGYFTYGKKQKAIIPLSSGVALMVLPYFLPTVLWMIMAGVLLVALPYFVRL